jgi:hypothetical protein
LTIRCGRRIRWRSDAGRWTRGVRENAESGVGSPDRRKSRCARMDVEERRRRMQAESENKKCETKPMRVS